MNLWLSSLLFALLLLSSSAETPEECQPLVSPQSLADPSVMFGRVNLLAGYADHAFYKAMMKMAESSWTNITGSPADNNEILMHLRSRANGTCVKATTKAKIEGNAMTSGNQHGTSEVYLLPSCDSCIVFLMKTTMPDFGFLLKMIQPSDADMPVANTARALLLQGKGQSVTESEMEHFKKQASCLGFSGELDYLYNPDISFCKEEECIEMPSPQ
ncbi:uncharacterized protein LOC119779127 [Cyprinodon tularosa]|uniref:uncharacterized protein LOC119779127 n=1 Tax=Cyprinodon tularosa TaxID=77115 RepID=UPI0018E259A6|nr:uncharacterized protein LOC119779127 [Cyprinodon tularosa]